jgi:3-hydroxybutyryl-CoA dehydrogenase
MTDIKTIGIAGCGTMGAGIAIVAARAGFRTVVLDTRQEALDKARTQTQGFLAKSVAKGELTTAQVDGIMANLVGTTKVNAI